MKIFRPLIGVLLIGLAAWSAVAQPPAQVPPMDIQEYKPKSTLVVPEHPVRRAKFPAIDVHNHLKVVDLPKVVPEMDQLNLRVLVNLSGGFGNELRSNLNFIREGDYTNRMVLFANIDFSEPIGPGFGQRAAKQLDGDVKAGAVGLKIFKNYGMRVKNARGERVHVDDPEMDPVWEMAGRLNVPVLIHVGEPSPFFDPIDKNNERWLELMLFPSRRVQPPENPSFNELMAERDRMFAKHPKTRFIAAHMAWHANDLGRLGKLLDRLPNVYTETGAILAELGRQPRHARAFFEKYQDRVMFGKDTYNASEFPYFWRTFETADEYFDYYRHYHAFWKLYGMELPDPVLKKLYSANAIKVVPGLQKLSFTN